MKLTQQLASAAARDAANKQMRKAGRASWNEDDFNLACEVLAKLTEGSAQ